MNIRLQFSYTPDDYVDFLRAYLKHRKSLTPRSQRGIRSPSAVLWGVIILILICFYALLSILPTSTAPAPAAPPAPMPAAPPASASPMEILLPLLPYLIVFVLVWGFLIWLRRSRLYYRRLAPQVMKVDEPRTAEIADTQLTIRETDAYSVMQWSHFMRCIETPSTFLLFIVPRQAHILPKRAFPSPESLNEFRAFAQAHIGNTPIGFPVLPPRPPPTAAAPAPVIPDKEPP